MGIGAISSAQAPMPLTAVRDLVASAKGDTATVSWRPPSRGSVARYQVEAHRNDYYDEASPDFGMRLVSGSTTSIVWPDLPLNHSVYFTVTPIATDTDVSPAATAAPFNATGTVRPTNSHCPAADPGYCVVVDTTDGLGKETRPGAGLLHGTVAAGSQWARPLKLNHWRIDAGNEAQYREAIAAVPRSGVIEMLSDAWFGESVRRVHGLIYATDPWASWPAYIRFVTTTVRRAERRGQHPIWDIQNEPENYPYDPTTPPTRARVEKQYLMAYRAIKRVDPHARVIGPSIDWQLHGDSPPWYIDMASFIPYAAAHHMRLYALSWHENSDARDQKPLLYREMPEVVRDDTEVVRELIAENPGIGSPKLSIDENSSASGQYIPGFAVGYLAAEDQAGVDEANRSCWSYPLTIATQECFRANLGGLLNRDGVPNANYWVMRDYAKLAGTRVASAVSDVNLSALAVTDGAGTTRIMLGRHQTCSQPTTGSTYCVGPSRLPPAVPTTLQVLVRTGATKANVGVQVVPNSLADMARPPATRHFLVSVRHGVATIQIPALGDGQALLVTVTPNATSGGLPASGDQEGHQRPAAHGAPLPTRLLPLSGTNQSVATLRPYPEPLRALLTDQYGNPLPNRRVTFTLGSSSHGRFANHADSVTVVTDRDGVATSPAFTAGLPLGGWNAAAYLTATGRSPGSPVGYFFLETRVA